MTNIKTRRELRKMTQKELAEKAKISLRTLQDYEQGRKSINQAAAVTVCRLADVLECDARDLLENEN